MHPSQSHSFIDWSIHSLLSLTPLLRSSTMTHWENVQSPSTETYVDGRRTHNKVWPASPRGSFMTVLLLLQCHATYSTTPSTLAWVDQSPISQRAIVTSTRYPLHTCYHLPCDPGYGLPACVRVTPPHGTPPHVTIIHITLGYARGVEFMGGGPWG